MQPCTATWPAASRPSRIAASCWCIVCAAWRNSPVAGDSARGSSSVRPPPNCATNKRTRTACRRTTCSIRSWRLSSRTISRSIRSPRAASTGRPSDAFLDHGQTQRVQAAPGSAGRSGQRAGVRPGLAVSDHQRVQIALKLSRAVHSRLTLYGCCDPSRASSFSLPIKPLIASGARPSAWGKTMCGRPPSRRPWTQYWSVTMRLFSLSALATMSIVEVFEIAKRAR